MLPSSTSNSERGAPASRRWRLVAVAVFVVLTGVECTLRSPEVRAHLPPRTHFYHPSIAVRLDAVERILSERKRVDVLFVGSSIVLTNVHPVIFDGVMASDFGTVVSFNAGLAGLWPSSVHLYLERLWLPAVRPRTVVQGIRYAELAAVTHAKNESQVWSGRVERAWRDGDPLTRLHARAFETIHLLQYRGALTSMLKSYQNGWSGAADDASDTYALHGYHPREGPLNGDMSTWEEDLPNEGSCEGGRCEVGLSALSRTVAAVRAAGADYILLNVPEHTARWHGRDAEARYRAYLDTLRAFAAAERVVFIDPTDGNPTQFQELPFHDFSHMTDTGARQFTRAIAQDMGPLLAASPSPRPTSMLASGQR